MITYYLTYGEMTNDFQKPDSTVLSYAGIWLIGLYHALQQSGIVGNLFNLLYFKIVSLPSSTPKPYTKFISDCVISLQDMMTIAYLSKYLPNAEKSIPSQSLLCPTLLFGSKQIGFM